MSAVVGTELSALAEQWRSRARKFMDEAERCRRPADLVWFTAMASTLEWAAGDLLWFASSPQMMRLFEGRDGGSGGSE